MYNCLYYLYSTTFNTFLNDSWIQTTYFLYSKLQRWISSVVSPKFASVTRSHLLRVCTSYLQTIRRSFFGHQSVNNKEREVLCSLPLITLILLLTIAGLSCAHCFTHLLSWSALWKSQSNLKLSALKLDSSIFDEIYNVNRVYTTAATTATFLQRPSLASVN